MDQQPFLVTFYGVRGSLPSPMVGENVREKLVKVLEEARPANLKDASSHMSKTSTFYRIYRRELYQSREILEINYDKPEDGPDETIEKIECIGKAVNKLPFYEKHLVKKHYFEGVNVAELGRQLNIQPARLTADIRIALLKIKKLCQ